MALVSNPQNSSNLFSAFNNQYNINKKSSEDLQDILKSLNIIDPESLSKDDLSIILKRIDDYNGFFTTQQLENIDYRKFNEHVFFDSAVNKVSYSFDRISKIPYDADELENIKFNNKTDGYTRHVLKNIYPKALGYTKFTGNQKLVVYDEQGKLLKDSATKKIGLLNPQSQKFSFDFWLNVDKANFVNNQVVFNKFLNDQNDQNGFICYLTTGLTNDDCYINFLLFINGKYTKSKCLITNDIWQNVVISVNSSGGLKKISFIINGNIIDKTKITESDNKVKNTSFGEEFKDNNIPFVLGGIFFIGNAGIDQTLSLTIDSNQVSFNNFHGSIDEFRFFHKVRSKNIVKKEMSKSIFSQKGLKLYLKMNEPAGNYNNSCLIIDYSGNKLHGLLYNVANNDIKIFTDTINIKINQDTPVKNEKLIDSPVFNAGYSNIVEIRRKLIEQAKKYDNENPNLVFNLMPKHYFLNAAEFNNLPVFSNEKDYILPSSLIKADGSTIGDPASLSASIPANNELVNIVLIWARFFDQLKAYISSITNLLNVDYDAINSNKIIGMQIPILCKMYGIKFKELLPFATKEKLNNQNLTYEDIVSDLSIRKIQNLLWQRFLINTQDFLKSKGTTRSIESTFGAFGIDFAKFINIKEYASFNDISKNNNYKMLELKKDTIDFGNTDELLSTPAYSDLSINDFSNNKSLVKIENIKTQTLRKNNVTQTFESGLSLNWTLEYFFKFNEVIKNLDILSSTEGYASKQCLFRLDTDGAPALIAYYNKHSNINNNLGKITIHIQPIKNNASYNVDLDILDIDIYNMPKYFCLSQSVDLTKNIITYSAFIDDIGKQIEIKDIQSASLSTDEIVNLNTIAETDENLSFYKNSLDMTIGNYNYANNNYLSYLIATNKDTTFQGQIYKIRAWDKVLTKSEINSHLKDLENLGTDNNNLLDNVIFDFAVDSKDFATSNGIKEVKLKDMSNNIYISNDEFEYLNTCKVMTRDTDNDKIFKYSSLLCKIQNPKIDEPIGFNRVNVISYENDVNKALANNDNQFPSNNMPIDFKYDEVSRVSIDMSIVKIINNDISKIISDINLFTSKISNSQSIFHYSYNEIEKLREDYFGKYSESSFINYASIGNIFKYFDNIMSTILYDIVPSRVRFEGFNFVYESHILERHKYEHKNKNSTSVIMNPENIYSFSREIPVSRRNLNYNTNRTLSKE
jgi:hypothetical protein